MSNLDTNKKESDFSMLDDLIKIIGGAILALVVIAFIGYLIWGWVAVVVLLLLVAIPIIGEIVKAQNKKQQELEEQRIAEEKAEKQREAKRLAEEQAARQKEAEAQAAKRRAAERAALYAKWEEKFNAEIDAIPSAEIELSNTKYAKRALRDMPEISFTNITKRTNPLTFTTFVVVDVETTGIAKTSKIIELSAVRFEGFEPVEKFSTLVDPESPIPPEATKVNQITNEMVTGAPKIWQVIPALQSFVGASPVVGHNLAFDLEFLYAYGFELDKPKQRFYDTLQLAKSVLKRANYDYSNDYDVDDYKLGTLCEYYGIYHAKAHRACSDCLVTGRLFEKLANTKMQ